MATMKMIPLIIAASLAAFSPLCAQVIEIIAPAWAYQVQPGMRLPELRTLAGVQYTRVKVEALDAQRIQFSSTQGRKIEWLTNIIDPSTYATTPPPQARPAQPQAQAQPQPQRPKPVEQPRYNFQGPVHVPLSQWISGRDFTGFSPGRVFILGNGQPWKQIDSRTVAYRPNMLGVIKVHIRSSGTHYVMAVEGAGDIMVQPAW